MAALPPEPPQWSVIADEADHIWLRIGDFNGVGVWKDTAREGVYASYVELTPTCVLATGHIQPLLPDGLAWAARPGK